MDGITELAKLLKERENERLESCIDKRSPKKRKIYGQYAPAEVLYSKSPDKKIITEQRRTSEILCGRNASRHNL